MRVSAVIPAFNEENRIGEVVSIAKRYVDEVLVVDDGSTDRTGEVAREQGAKIIRNERNFGYLESLRRGFRVAKGDIVVTLDGDGEHDPGQIPSLLGPILDGSADLVFGKRKEVPRVSERIINRLVRYKTGITDSGTGFRAIRREIAKRMKLNGFCSCGTFLLEAVGLGARVAEVEAPERSVKKPRRIAWKHLPQFFVVLKMLVFG